jgi:hypothetical protein
MKLMRRVNPKQVFALAAVLILGTFPAYAGPITTALTYVQNNILTDLETLAIIGLGIVLFSMQVRWQLVIAICAGVWVLANADTIRTAISG